VRERRAIQPGAAGRAVVQCSMDKRGKVVRNRFSRFQRFQ
jgi:hypothetical protein